MRRRGISRFIGSIAAALFGASMFIAPVIADATTVLLQPDTKGCNGVLPSTNGNTDMTLVGGTLWPGGTAVFQITYPMTASDVGKQFTITACAFINGVAALKYLVSFVPSNQSFLLRMTFAVPANAPVGGQYCNYAKTTRSPTAAQASQRKAGPSCFIIRAPPTATSNEPPVPRPAATPPPPTSVAPDPPAAPRVGTPPLLPNTATAP
jgi:hypothetical protein